MKSEAEIKERIKDLKEMSKRNSLYQEEIYNPWLDALYWVLGELEDE